MLSYLTTKQAATMLDVDEKQIRRWTASGLLHRTEVLPGRFGYERGEVEGLVGRVPRKYRPNKELR